jgi:hypothetical protein
MPPHAAHAGLVQTRDFLALEAHRAGGGLEQAQDQTARCRLAAARLADQRQRLPAPDREAHIVDSADMA